MEEWEAYCAAQDDKVEGCFEFTVSLVYTANTTCTEKAPEDSGFWWPEQTLRKPVGICTKNVIGNTVIFECDPMKGIVNEHVYHDVLDGSVCSGTECTCESDIKYTLPIGNGCSEQFFGGMHMVWDNFCQSPNIPGNILVFIHIISTILGIHAISSNKLYRTFIHRNHQGIANYEIKS